MNKSTSLKKLKKDLRLLADKDKAKQANRYFKTGKGEYAEGDQFLGISTPDKRKVARKYNDLSFKNLNKLLRSKYHDERQLALFILIHRMDKHYKKQHKKSSATTNETCNGNCKIIYELYIKNLEHVNNWDLIDISAHKIIGRYLQDKDKGTIYELALSDDLWEKRISMISTFWYIKESQFKDTLKIARILLYDDHDLIHKAVGWALREVGKKDKNTETNFLDKHYQKMPRTMLRYAIEKFPETLRQQYLKGER